MPFESNSQLNVLIGMLVRDVSLLLLKARSLDSSWFNTHSTSSRGPRHRCLVAYIYPNRFTAKCLGKTLHTSPN